MISQHNFEIYYLQYILLFVFLLYSFYKNQTKLALAKNNKQFWWAATLPIIGYGIWMGLRFGRGIDWNHYYERYYDIYNHFSQSDYELVFKYLCYTFASLKIPYYLFVCIMDMALMAALLRFYKKYGKAIPFILTFFLFFCFQVENYIRWYIGVIFFLFYITYLPYAYSKKKYTLYIILFAILAIGIHVGFLPILLFLLIFTRLKKLLLNPYICILLFVITLFLSDNSIMIPLMKYLSIFAIDEKSTSYVTHAADILTGNFGHFGVMKITRINDIIKYILMFSYPILIVPKLLEKKVINIMEANIFILWVPLFPILKSVEIFDRYSSLFALYGIVVMGCAYYYSIKQYRFLPTHFKILFAGSCVSFIWLFYFIILHKTEWYKVLYIWNSNGLDYLPAYLFLN